MGGLEFHADIILPYKNRFQAMPMHGLFVIIQLESENEGVLGRITSISSKGRLASGSGEDFGIRAISEGRPIPEDLREQYLKYEVDIRVLGVVRNVDGKVVFVPSHRRLPHVGSKVAFLSPELIREIVDHNGTGAEIGHLALGEYIYAENDDRLSVMPWMQIVSPNVVPRFDVHSLVSRRTLVFARAGFGKSNLVKLLFGELYKTTPTVRKRKGRRVPVGTVIFDPDGEYYWPDDKGRPGLCDVPELENQVVVFTPKEGPSEFYQSFVAGNIRLDIRRLRPADVVSIALSPERQTQQNVRKIIGLNPANWQAMVDLVYKDGHGADEQTIRDLLGLNSQQDAELYAARSNMTHIVSMLHDPSSQMLDMLLTSLRQGKLCIVDISQMRGSAGLTLSGIILRRIFDHNQEEFTRAEPTTIPTIAVVEEAQSVLNSTGEASEGPYISWVKEGRKYDLGAVLITQQPGSIPNEILSQGDNWFIFHLLSSGDLAAAKRANAHFSDDLLSSLLNEPIPGNGVFWSSSNQKPIPIPIRAMSFEGAHSPIDDTYTRAGANTYASALRDKFSAQLTSAADGDRSMSSNEIDDMVGYSDGDDQIDTEVDALAVYSNRAIEGFRSDKETLDRIRSQGVPWRGVLEAIKKHIPDTVEDRGRFAHNLVPRAMDEEFGDSWDTEKRESKSGPGFTTWIVVK